MKDLTILMDLEAGRLADMLAEASANEVAIVAGCMFPRLGGRVAHATVRDADAEALASIVKNHGGVVADLRECVVVPADYKGGVEAAARAVADAGIAINVAYFGSRGELVLSTAEVSDAQVALGL